eukprot:scaffold86374_cov19-Tisochrysis_lutea.AAC.2
MGRGDGGLGKEFMQNELTEEILPDSCPAPHSCPASFLAGAVPLMLVNGCAGMFLADKARQAAGLPAILDLGQKCAEMLQAKIPVGACFSAHPWPGGCCACFARALLARVNVSCTAVAAKQSGFLVAWMRVVGKIPVTHAKSSEIMGRSTSTGTKVVCSMGRWLFSIRRVCAAFKLVGQQLELLHTAHVAPVLI